MDHETQLLLSQIIAAGVARGMLEKDILRRAGLGKTTLSKAKAAGDTRLSTLSRMANAVGLRLSLVPNNPTLVQVLNRNLFGDEQAAEQ
jgi:DNA-binding phage protein